MYVFTNSEIFYLPNLYSLTAKAENLLPYFNPKKSEKMLTIH